MNGYVFLFLFFAAIIAFLWYNFKSEKCEDESETCQPQAVSPSKQSENKSEPDTAGGEDDSIEIRADGTWICPNDETINDGDTCIICGQSRLGVVCIKDEPSGIKETDYASAPTNEAPQRILKKGFSVAYPAKISSMDTSEKAKKEVTENVYSANMDESTLTYDDG